MRLIDTETLEFHEFWDGAIPKYAILSHTWEKDEEVTFQDWNHRSTAKKKKKGKTNGYLKINMACRKAQEHGLKYLWADTNCIDKSSSAELSEAINSMFLWYQKAAICYVYLSDVGSVPCKWENQFCRSKWFKRGWTLQELLAPKQMTFYDQDWVRIASRKTMAKEISSITRINERYLDGDGEYNQASVAQKMSWISRRQTTRIEDMAYCMLGIFGINMPLLYGEGRKSFIRLQEEIIRTSNDQTIFCWTWTKSVPTNWASLLAPCPQVFKSSNKFISDKSVIKNIKMTYKMTNAGLSINLPIVQAWNYYLAIISAQDEGCNPAGEYDHLVCVPLEGSLAHQSREMRRIRFPPGPVPIPVSWAFCQLHVYISCEPKTNPQDDAKLISRSTLFGRDRYPFLLVFGDTEKLLDEETRLRDYNRSEISPGNRPFLLETISPVLEVVPPGVLDEQRSLVTLDRTSLPRGFLIKIGKNGFQRVLFIGMGNRSRKPMPASHELYRVCNVVSESVVKKIPDNEELLAQQIELMEEKYEDCEESSRYGIKIILKEEAVTGKDFICLTYISCGESHADKLVSGDANGTHSDVGVADDRHHDRVRHSNGGLFEEDG